MDWRPLFPLARPRPEQEQALDFMVEQFLGEGKEFVVAELGTGVGKSAIAVTMARWFRTFHEELLALDEASADSSSAYILTSQKVLQDQYLKDYPEILDLRSSANFECSWLPNQTCAETLRVKEAMKARQLNVIGCDQPKHVCPYRAAKEAFKQSPIGVTNYSYLLSEAVYAGGLKPRELAVFDEAHNIESEVRRWASISFRDQFARNELGLVMPRWDAKDEERLAWVRDKYAPALQALIGTTLDRIENLVASNQAPPHLRDLTKRYELLDKHICQVNRYLQEKGASKDDYLVVPDNEGFQLKPLNVAYQARRLLYSKARKKLLMSATVLDQDIFRRSAGLPNDDSVAFISIPSPFKPKAFGFTSRTVGKLTAKEMGKTLPKLVTEVQRILHEHPNEKGIIHTNSYDVTRAVGALGDPRLLVQATAADRDRILKEHLTSKRPTVLVSPAMTEGLDLHGDLGRFQIVCKVPFPYLGDRVTKLKMKKDPRWYAWCTVRVLVQAVGRCVRNESDWTKTYFLDSCFLKLLVDNPDMFPHHFEELDEVRPT